MHCWKDQSNDRSAIVLLHQLGVGSPLARRGPLIQWVRALVAAAARHVGRQPKMMAASCVR